MVAQCRVSGLVVINIALKLTDRPDGEWAMVDASADELRSAEERGVDLVNSMKRNFLNENSYRAA